MNKIELNDKVLFEWNEEGKEIYKVIEENKKEGTFIIKDELGFMFKVFPEQVEKIK